MPTPHLEAEPTTIAADVLLPGDPARARRIAEAVLDGAVVVSDVRANPVYTGTYEGRPLSVLASGMGMASTAIYATELSREYGVQRIVRVGTAGSLSPAVRARQVVVATAAHTDGAVWARPSGTPLHLSNTASFALLAAAARHRAEGVVHFGPIFSTDTFYGISPATIEEVRRSGALAVEMESAALFRTAALEGFEALTVLSISGDHEVSLPAIDREAAFGDALAVALAALRPAVSA